MTHVVCQKMLPWKLIKAIAVASLFTTLCASASATTLIRCKVGKQIVYSDTECPQNQANAYKRRGQSEFSSGAPSRKITVRTPRKTTVGMKVPRKSSKASYSHR